MTTAPTDTIDNYIAGFPKPVRERLQKVRSVIRSAAPDATEAMKYRMPTFVLGENLVHFAAFEHHIGFYPTPSAIAAFAAELSDYKSAKGSVQFPLDQSLPLDLIKRMVEFRVEEVRRKTAGKKRTKK
jgi:uncharacterized protein YdhG (YjbR/CyaY superfamily)